MAERRSGPRYAPFAALAEFANEDDAIAGARALRDQGYTELDALTPRPVEALEALIVPQRSTLTRSVLIAGVIGAVTGLLVQWFCNAYDYPINVGGRPPFSLPAFIPITFEIMVLFAGLTAFFSALHRMHLPWLAHPVFDAPGIESASIDRFWLVVSASDPRFDVDATPEALRELGGERIAIVPADAHIERATPPEPEGQAAGARP